MLAPSGLEKYNCTFAEALVACCKNFMNAGFQARRARRCWWSFKAVHPKGCAKRAEVLLQLCGANELLLPSEERGPLRELLVRNSWTKSPMPITLLTRLLPVSACCRFNVPAALVSGVPSPYHIVSMAWCTPQFYAEDSKATLQHESMQIWLIFWSTSPSEFVLALLRVLFSVTGSHHF